MNVWLTRLQEQLAAALPKEVKSLIPPLDKLYQWVDELVMGAEQCCNDDISAMSCLSWRAAWQNEVALIAALVVGRYIPPIRLEILRTLVHPASIINGLRDQCQDRDCRDRRCPGNHLSIFQPAATDAGAAAGSSSQQALVAGAGDLRRIHFKAPHHKNDRRGFAAIEFDLPPGPLTERLLDHLDFGHTVLTQTASTAVLRLGQQPPPQLFVSRAGNPFSASTLTQFWAAIMKEVKAEIPYFPPGLARTSFVDAYTAEFGDEPLLWDGAATVMGNTTKQWRVSYNPNERQREAQRAVDRHGGFAAGLATRGVAGGGAAAVGSSE